MASFLKRAQLYLGLGPDDEYEEYDDYGDYDERPAAREAYEEVAPPAPVRVARPAPPAQPRPDPPVTRRPAVVPTRTSRPAPPPPPPSRATREVAAVRPARPAPPPPEPVHDGSAVRTLPPNNRGGDVAPPPPKPKPVVRAIATNPKPSVIAPRSFNHAQEVADRFKASQPVIVNLQGVEKELSRRLLDFCSGICYALGGHMEKVAARVYLLTPSNVEVSAEDRRRLQERGLYDG